MKFNGLEPSKALDGTLYENLDDLHSLLQSKRCDFTRFGSDYVYIVSFSDVALGTVYSSGIYPNPLLSLRDLPSILEHCKANSDNVAIQLVCAMSKDFSSEINFVQFFDSYLSPYLYFKRGDSDEIPGEELSNVEES